MGGGGDGRLSHDERSPQGWRDPSYSVRDRGKEEEGVDQESRLGGTHGEQPPREHLRADSEAAPPQGHARQVLEVP